MEAMEEFKRRGKGPGNTMSMNQHVWQAVEFVPDGKLDNFDGENR